MLIYEKKVEGTNHVFGTMGNIPDETDSQLTYKDEYGDVVTPSLTDTYLDNGHGGIIEKSSNTPIDVFIGDVCVVNSGEDIAISKIEITTPPTKTEYVNPSSNEIDLTGMVVTATYSDENTKTVTDYTYTPDKLPLETCEFDVTITYKGKTATQSLSVSYTE